MMYLILSMISHTGLISVLINQQSSTKPVRCDRYIFSTRWSLPMWVWGFFSVICWKQIQKYTFLLHFSPQQLQTDSIFQPGRVSSHALLSLWLSITPASFHIPLSPLPAARKKSYYLPFRWSESCFLSSLPLTSHLLLFSWLWNRMIRNAFIRNACTSQCSCEDQIRENPQQILNLVFYYIFTLSAVYSKKLSLRHSCSPLGFRQVQACFANWKDRTLGSLFTRLRSLLRKLELYKFLGFRHIWACLPNWWVYKQASENSFQKTNPA